MDIRLSDKVPSSQLPTSVQMHILSLLPPNDRALSGRLACRDEAEGLNSPQHCTASLSQPLPAHAVSWAVEAGQQHVRQLPFRDKLHLLSTAAASGSEANLEVALALLQPSIFPEMLQDGRSASAVLHCWRDPGVAAVKAGHPQLLRLLLHHCPGMLRCRPVLESAAKYCNLEGLQTVWEVLQDRLSSSGQRGSHSRSSSDGADWPDQDVFDAAAGSATPDAVAKMEWVLDVAEHSSCRLAVSTAAAAARSGDLDRLRWLQVRGCPMHSEHVLLPALAHASLAVAQWLVEEAGCVLPGPGGGDSTFGAYSDDGRRWQALVETAAQSPVDGGAKLRWLQDEGGALLDSDRS